MLASVFGVVGPCAPALAEPSQFAHEAVGDEIRFLRQAKGLRGDEDGIAPPTFRFRCGTDGAGQIRIEKIGGVPLRDQPCLNLLPVQSTLSDAPPEHGDEIGTGAEKLRCLRGRWPLLCSECLRSKYGHDQKERGTKPGAQRFEPHVRNRVK